jgi:tetratricopeptide (TPR) repeat protein
MKRHLAVLITALVPAVSLFAQDAYFTAINAPMSAEVQVRNNVFDITSQGGSYDAEMILREMESRFDIYNRLFRFNTNQLQAPLKVRAFTSKADYDAYVISKLGSTRDGAVYLHYDNAERRELVINRGSQAEERVLPHQAFVQFFRAFVPHPPTWMREGFAIYFNTLKFNKETRELTYEENLSWLETVKRISAEHIAPSFDSVFQADISGQIPEYFHPVAWALVSFFLNSGGNGDYFRSLTESFLLLNAKYSPAENSNVVLGRLTSWTDLATMRRDYDAYISSRLTFAELIETGQRAYSQKNFSDAETSFLEALYQKPGHFAPYYYLGLIAYEQKNYDIADQYYRSALQFGADFALVQYAMGVNAAASGRTDEAVEHLKQAAAAAPERYSDRVIQIIQKISPASSSGMLLGP